ncbi:MAG: class I adenylate cyclase [Proteobacteria bacterium]|nr:class I adenylate cyclase [Pseudomonadota bacterium]
MNTITSAISENRNAFMTYTIARIRELLRNLPQSKSDLFQGLPFLLHINAPEFPGYIESNEKFYGIDRFEHSGFYKYALRRFGHDQDIIKGISPDKPVILGLYLMGSAGTLTQSKNSDFDYWVIIQEKNLGPFRLSLLDRKLRSLETWCREKHNQDVTFFIMDIEKLRQNEFSTVDGESSGSAQRTLLKDEFYRTFIMIAGKIPLWAVLPQDVPDDELQRTMVTMATDGEDYMDTGPLFSIDTRECLGAVLWQVYKARKDPVKALIKSSLAAFYAFNASDHSALISFQVKTSFSKARIDDYLCDPYVTVFDTIMAFYKDMDDHEGLDLIMECIILRILSYPLIEIPDETSPKGRILTHFVNTWDKGKEYLALLRNAATWSEPDKNAFEDRIFDKLSFLYELLLRNAEDEGPVIFMKREDLDILKNRTSAFLQKKPDKLAHCSTFLRLKAPDLSLWISPTRENKDTWAVYGAEDPIPLFTGPNYLKTLGWIFANQLENARFISTPPHFGSIRSFFKNLFPRPDHVFTRAPLWEKIVVLQKHPDHGHEQSAEYLLFNSWGEFYFNTLEFSPLESMDQKCYKIAELIFNIQLKNQNVTLQHLICQPYDGTHHSCADIVKNHLDMMGQAGPKMDITPKGKTLPGETKPPVKKKPFLDLL